MDVINFGFCDAGHAAAEAGNDLVCKAMGNLACGIFTGLFTVLLGEDLWILRVLDVKEEAIDGDA